MSILGFMDTKKACDYCKLNGADECCNEVGCLSLSVGGIVGIVVGCVVLLAMAGGLGLYFYKKRQRKTQMKQQFNDSSSVFGYESVAASQRVLLPSQPLISKPPPLVIQPQPIEEFYEVKHPYPPQMGDELGLHVGDIVCVAMNFDDGWALGFNVTTGLKGVFPLVCVAPVPEELLEQLLVNESTTKVLVEDDLRRSLSLASQNKLPTSELTQHSNIPRRTASMMRSYDYRESDSPTSPTLSTPFFDPHHPASQPSVQNQEAFEMHEKRINRISKLEE
ncbi:hypothetical protein BY458DRAFT_436415 [Sporodiniella umbellata]|nr:hypothetical protein BY458DRAFT_436415 [Sporodiniella umbellata]